MITNRMFESFAILRFSLERLKERERALVLLSTLSGILLLWYLLAYMPQSHVIERTQTSMNDITQSTAKLLQKRTMIEGLIKDNSVSQLMTRYERVQNEMNELEQNINRYQTRYIDYNHLNSLLYSILQQTTDVSIVQFSNISTIVIEGAEKTPATSIAAPAATADAAAQKTLPTGPKVERYQYKLILKGSYPAIANYLSKLEATGWQFYWDKLTYEVQQYPDALATIEFYTLRPAALDEPVANGGQ